MQDQDVVIEVQEEDTETIIEKVFKFPTLDTDKAMEACRKQNFCPG
jgi:hypothetical protein